MLPKNSTSVFQPLDQGIIYNFQTYYRKQWIKYIINSIDGNINPFTYSHLKPYKLLHWCSRAWYQHVNNTTIYQCFCKSTVIQPSITLPATPPVDLSFEYNALQQQIPDVMDLKFILQLSDEDDQEEDDPVTLADIIQHHTQQAVITDEAIDEDVDPQPVVSRHQWKRLQPFRYYVHSKSIEKRLNTKIFAFLIKLNVIYVL